MMYAALVCCAMVMAVLTACSVDDNPAQTASQAVVGKWYGDITGKTYAKWNYGKCWQTMEFKADGTGEFLAYYTIGEDKALAREAHSFTYTATDDGQLKLAIGKGNKDMQYLVTGGKLMLTLDGTTVEYQKTNDDMAAKFEQWNKAENLISVPEPAKYTMFVYGNAGGKMDDIIENGFWKEAKKFLTDQGNVRVVCFYKYGKPYKNDQGEEVFKGQYAQPGDIVWFELNDKTELEKIRENGFQTLGWGDVAKELKICDPNTVRAVIEISSLFCPAKDYMFAIWGHGNGFVPFSDVPGKYVFDHPIVTANQASRRGVIADEWNNSEQLNMYELHDAIKASGIDRLHTLFFHNCLMGNIETLTEVTDCADYIFASAHSLEGDGELLYEYLHAMMDTGDAEASGRRMFERVDNSWPQKYNRVNGDYKMMRTSKFKAILDVCKHMATRLQQLYPTQKEAIDRATRQVYRFHEYMDPIDAPFYDIADYAHQLANETQDAEFAAIAQEADQAFNDAVITYRDVNSCPQHLDHYTLSVSLYLNHNYLLDLKSAGFAYDIWEGYEMSSFHKYTGWGNWLRLNQQEMRDANPHCGGGFTE